MRIGLPILLAVTISACAAHPPTSTQSSSKPTPGEERIRAELERLNQWCAGQDDCDVAERPKAYPGRTAHGETRGFILSSKNRLRELGGQVQWDPKKKQYRLAEASQSTVRTKDDVVRYDGKQAVLLGQYRPVAMPSKRGTSPGQPGRPGEPREYAFIVLADKTVVYLERYNTPLARRSAAERSKYEGRQVRLRGTVHRVCPSSGQSHNLPCITAIKTISIVSP